MQRRRIEALRKQKAPLGSRNNEEIANSLPIGRSTTQLSLREEVQSARGTTHTPTTSVPSSTDPRDGISLPQDSQTFSHNVEANGIIEPSSSDDESSDEDFGVLPCIGYTSESSSDEEGEVKDNKGRIRIRPTGQNSFEGCDGILRNAYSILHCYYKGPWRKWGMVPDGHKDVWWEEFKKRYFWKDKHAVRVYKHWRAKCSEHMRSALAYARTKGKRPDFIEPEHWTDMLEGWEQDDTFKRQSEMNKRNRASEAPNGIGLFAGGSKPIVKHKADYKRKHGKKMSQEKLVEKAYKKTNGEWSSEKVPIVLAKYKDLCEEFEQSHPEGITQKDANKLWLDALDAVGGGKKGKAFCLAALGSSTSNLRNPASCFSPRTSNNSTSQSEEMRRLDMERSMEERMQYLLRKQREEDAAMYHQQMLEMHRSRYVLPPPQLNASFPPMLNSSQQYRFVEQLPASTHLFDPSAFAALRPRQDGNPNVGFEGGYNA